MEVTPPIAIESRKPVRPWARALKLGFSLLATLYLFACLAFYFLNDHSLFPDRGTYGLAQAVVPASPDYELVHFNTAQGDSIVAMFGRGLDGDDHVLPDAASRPTVLYFYGNAISLANCFNEFRGFRRLGFNVMIPDYPGYGMSGGHASERSFYACADAAFDQLCHRPDVDLRQIASVGWSLGAAVATDLAVHRPVMCLATFSAFTSWPEQTARHHFWLPTAWLLSSRFDNVTKFATLRCPVLIVHGRHDEIIPFVDCERLAAARGGVVPLVLNSRHNVFENNSAGVMSALGRFIDGCRTSKGDPLTRAVHAD